MDDGAAAIAVLIFVLSASALAFAMGEWRGERLAMVDAFNRGLAVQCPGVTGHHWECEP
jgi:hypothetical protein